jgi:hypothetical protein
MISESGRNPVFSADGKAIYVNAGYYPSLSLIKIDVQSLEQSTIATSKYAVSINVAPDRSGIIFTEFDQVYLTPYSGTRARAHTQREIRPSVY